MSFEGTMVEQCAPTLAGVKPASLFRCQTEDRRGLCETVGRWDRMMRASGVRARILKFCPRTNSFLIYVYRESQIDVILRRDESREFLSGCGYRAGGSEQMIGQLARRLCVEQEFPHEVGVFLGYPLEDVKGFIKNKGKNYTFCGYWKSYGDPERAKAVYLCYRKCTAIYQRLYEKGTPITRLIVAA